MENIALIIVVIFLIVMAFNGYRRGGVRIILSMASLVLTILISAYFTPTVSKILKEHTPIYDTIYEQMENFVEKKMDKGAEDEDLALMDLPLPKSLTGVLVENNNRDTYDVLGATTFGSYTAGSLSIILLNAISYIGIFIIVNIVFKIILVAADILSKLPIISGLNRLIGMILGIIQGTLILWVLCIALTAISGTLLGQQIFEMINASRFLTFIYDNNYIMAIITSVLKVK